jgi:hypothetical protein
VSFVKRLRRRPVGWVSKKLCGSKRQRAKSRH